MCAPYNIWFQHSPVGMPPVKHLALLEGDHRAPPARSSSPPLSAAAPLLLPLDEDPRRRGLGVAFRLRPRCTGAAALLPGGVGRVRVGLSLVARP